MQDTAEQIEALCKTRVEVQKIWNAGGPKDMTKETTARKKLLVVPRESLIKALTTLGEQSDLEVAAYSRSRNSCMEAYWCGWGDALVRLREIVHGTEDLFVDLEEARKTAEIDEEL